jgi:hypothetical protein
MREQLISALQSSFRDLESAVDGLNKYIINSVPTPHPVRTPKPRRIGSKWIIGIISYQANPVLGHPGWFPLYGDQSIPLNHKSEVWLYRQRVIHVEPEVPREYWRNILNGRFGCDAMYYQFSPDRPGLEMICYDLGWNPSRIVAAIRKIRYFSRWCYYTRDRLMKLSARRLESRREREALDFIDDLLVEQKLKGGNP